MIHCCHMYVPKRSLDKRQMRLKKEGELLTIDGYPADEGYFMFEEGIYFSIFIDYILLGRDL